MWLTTAFPHIHPSRDPPRAAAVPRVTLPGHPPTRATPDTRKGCSTLHESQTCDRNTRKNGSHEHALGGAFLSPHTKKQTSNRLADSRWTED